LKKRNYTEDLGVDGITIFKLILKEYDVMVRTGFNWLTIRPSDWLKWIR